MKFSHAVLKAHVSRVNYTHTPNTHTHTHTHTHTERANEGDGLVETTPHVAASARRLLLFSGSVPSGPRLVDVCRPDLSLSLSLSLFGSQRVMTLTNEPPLDAAVTVTIAKNPVATATKKPKPKGEEFKKRRPIKKKAKHTHTHTHTPLYGTTTSTQKESLTKKKPKKKGLDRPVARNGVGLSNDIERYRRVNSMGKISRRWGSGAPREAVVDPRTRLSIEFRPESKGGGAAEGSD